MENFSVKFNDQDFTFPCNAGFDSCMSSLTHQLGALSLEYTSVEGKRYLIRNEIDFESGLAAISATDGYFSALRLKEDFCGGVERSEGESNTDKIVYEDASTQIQNAPSVSKGVGNNRIVAEKRQNKAALDKSVQTECDFHEEIRYTIKQDIHELLGKDKFFEGSQCSNCRIKPIFKVKYTCVKCTWISLCEKCEIQFDHEHSLLKHRVSPCDSLGQVVNNFENRDIIEKIQSLGFQNEDEIRNALVEANYDYNKAVALLLNS